MCGRNPIRSARVLMTCLFMLAAMNRCGWSAGTQYTILHNFKFGTSDGSNPIGGVAIVGSKIYGTTLLWGSGQDGVLYSVNLDGTGYQVLHDFSGGDGNQPESDLIFAGTTLFGTAQFGGQGGGAGNGTIFSYNTNTASFQDVRMFAGASPMLRRRWPASRPSAARYTPQRGKGAATMAELFSA